MGKLFTRKIVVGVKNIGVGMIIDWWKWGLGWAALGLDMVKGGKIVSGRIKFGVKRYFLESSGKNGAFRGQLCTIECG